MSELVRSARELIVLLGFITAFAPRRGFNQLPVYTWELYKGGQLVWNGGRCSGYERLVIGVASKYDNKNARDMVRRTWGRHCARLGVRFIFMLGRPFVSHHNFARNYNTDSLENLLAERNNIKRLNFSSSNLILDEVANNNDIVFGDFVDRYRNLTLKTLSMFEWAITYCPRARWFLKTDDDVFLYVANLISFIGHLEHDNSIWGSMNTEEKVSRNPKKKNFVDKVQYEEEMFPPYTIGSAYLVPMWAVGWLLKEARRVPYVSTEDSFITGIVAQRLGIPRTENFQFNVPLERLKAGAYRETALAVHLGRQTKNLCELWYNLTEPYTDYRLFFLSHCNNGYRFEAVFDQKNTTDDDEEDIAYQDYFIVKE